MNAGKPSSHMAGELLYFGKLPCRGDFVRSTQHASLVADLDQWQSRTLERLSADPRWKLVYDEAPEFPFAIVSTGSRVALSGHWQASQDSSGRRFPFIVAATFDWPSPRDAAVLAPMMLAAAWGALSRAGRAARGAAEHADAQASLHAVQPQAMTAERARAEPLDDVVRLLFHQRPRALLQLRTEALRERVHLPHKLLGGFAEVFLVKIDFC